jgi:hypothetical protein
MKKAIRILMVLVLILSLTAPTFANVTKNDVAYEDALINKKELTTDFLVSQLGKTFTAVVPQLSGYELFGYTHWKDSKTGAQNVNIQNLYLKNVNSLYFSNTTIGGKRGDYLTSVGKRTAIDFYDVDEDLFFIYSDRFIPTLNYYIEKTNAEVTYNYDKKKMLTFKIVHTLPNGNVKVLEYYEKYIQGQVAIPGRYETVLTEETFLKGYYK